MDCGQIDHAPFGFGNDFVFYDEDVARLKPEAALAESCKQFVGEGIAGLDFVLERDRDQAEFIGRTWLVFLSPLRSWRILGR
jgi:hypothetical protein